MEKNLKFNFVFLKPAISGCVALKSFVWETQDCNTSLPFLCEDRQATSVDITALRMSTNTVAPSFLSTHFIQGLNPLLVTKSKQIPPNADKDNEVELEKVYFKSSAKRKARSLVLKSCLSGWMQRNNYCYKVTRSDLDFVVALFIKTVSFEV